MPKIVSNSLNFLINLSGRNRFRNIGYEIAIKQTGGKRIDMK